jgi:hypothetical protein
MCSLCDMDEDVLTLIASSLSPPDVFALVTSGKCAFWSKRDPPLAVTLVQAALRRHLDALLQDLTLRTKDCLPWTLQDLFPEEEREKDFDASGRPQVLLSGSLAVQSALGIHPGDEAWKRCDVDIFCTWEAAPAVRRRLIERCKLICSGVVGLCVTLN